MKEEGGAAEIRSSPRVRVPDQPSSALTLHLIYSPRQCVYSSLSKDCMPNPGCIHFLPSSPKRKNWLNWRKNENHWYTRKLLFARNISEWKEHQRAAWIAICENGRETGKRWRSIATLHFFARFFVTRGNEGRWWRGSGIPLISYVISSMQLYRKCIKII